MKTTLLVLIAAGLLSAQIAFADEASSTALDTTDTVVSAPTGGVQFCNYSNYQAAMKSCNNTLSTLSLMSTDRLQITGGCTDDTTSSYCAIFRGRVTIIQQ